MTFQFAAAIRGSDASHRTAPDYGSHRAGSRQALLDLQRLAGNRAVARIMDTVVGAGPSLALQRRGGVSHDLCPRSTLVASRDATTASVVVSRQSAAARSPEDQCPRYERGEVRKSRTDEGHLPVDVHEDVRSEARFLLVADFGVAQSKVKVSTRREPLLHRILEDLAANDMYQLRLEGSTDCIGRPGANQRLKHARAEAVLGLLDDATRTRAEVVDGGLGTYVRPNTTPEGRAANRAVAIAIEASADYEAERVPSKRRSRREIIEHARAVWRRKGARADEDWTFYGSLTMLLNPKNDDTYVDGLVWQFKGADVARSQPKRLRDEIIKVIDPNLDDATNYRALEDLAKQLEQGMSFAASLAPAVTLGGRSAMSDCHMRIIRWMRQRTESSRSIYHTWEHAVVSGPTGPPLTLETPCWGF